MSTIRLSMDLKRRLTNIKKRTNKSYNDIIEEISGVKITKYITFIDLLISDKNLDLICSSFNWEQAIWMDVLMVAWAKNTRHLVWNQSVVAIRL